MQTTKHNHQTVFGRREPGCPRCTELKLGMPARQWRGQRVSTEQTRRISEIRNHDCKRSGCGPVCTAFDW